MTDVPPRPGSDALGRRLAEARRYLSALELPAPLAAMLHRQFIAVCDAVKAAGADTATGERRLAAFLATLEQAVRTNPVYKSRKDNSTS